MLRILWVVALATPLFVPLAAQAASFITLDQAIDLALASDPTVKASEAGTSASLASLKQAGQLPNPTIGITAENFGGTGSVSGLRSAEYTLSYGQMIEVGGDRSAREAVASGDLKLANARLATQRLETVQTVRHAYILALASETKLKVVQERASFISEMNRTVRQRSRQGRDSSMVESQARASAAEVAVDLMQAERAVKLSRIQLSTLWNGVDDGFVLDQAFFEKPSFDADALPVDQGYPDLAQYNALKSRATANIALEKARAIPDPEISAGIRRFASGSETAFIVGLSIPFPVYDSNRNNIERAQSERLQADLEEVAARRDINLKLASAVAGRDSARAEIEALRADAIPQATQALGLARAGYERGAFSYLEIADASRGLNALRERLVGALQTFHESQITIDRLTGRSAITDKSEGYRP